jgi:hypothetical protein
MQLRKGSITVSDQVFECIGKGGRYTVVATAFGAGTMKEHECLFVYKNEEGMYFVRTHDDFWARMRELPKDPA